MRDVERKVSSAISIGVRSSGKTETREHRVRFYTEKLTEAKLEVQYFLEMLRLEQAQDMIADRYAKKCAWKAQQLGEELQSLKLENGGSEMRAPGGGESEMKEGEEWDTTVEKKDADEW